MMTNLESRMHRPIPRLVLVALLACACSTSSDAQSGRKSQLASVSQTVSDAKIDIVYRRPVARGRALFGALVPWGKVWTPSADSAALFSATTDLLVEGSKLPAGRYAIWMIPDEKQWTVLFTSKPAFHLVLPKPEEEVLRVKVTPHEGEHMESLGFYFPMVDADSAVLNMHWGKTVVPLKIRSRLP
jgi:hypothetical protein